ncbi:FAD-dependent oxidoreductase [Achromobacter sp. GG226]|nr:FAD-dependent oxidoreductase [Verticiella sp. GG226]
MGRLAAAVALHDAGHAVTVFEAGHTPGGRAQRLSAHAGFGAPLDNGQHILLGAYSATLALMRRLHRNPAEHLWRLPLTLATPNGSFHLRAPRLPAPLHTAAALLGARGLSWAERLAAVRLVRSLQRRAWRPDAATVTDLMREHRQPDALVQRLWRPLCLAALNTTTDAASAALFCAVLRDTLDAPREASDLLLPRTDLSALWPDAAAALCDMRYGHPVRQLAVRPDAVDVDDETFDAVVLAVPPPRAARLLAPLPDASALQHTLDAFSFLPIGTFTLRLARPLAHWPAPMVMLQDDPAQGRHGQWLFDRTRLLGLRSADPEITVVVSDATALAALPRGEAAQALTAQLRAEVHLPEVLASKLVIDKHATFAAVPGLARPDVRTPWPRLVLAGDWTDTGYPGVLEGAVRSGQAAAQALVQSFAQG